jgi:23S rRNA (uridine2552-2'-O)-methyltransferase
MARELHDHYFKQAQREGYRSRAAYKLMEIDERRSVLQRGDAVLDCGCAPGSWLQVAAERIGPKGVVVGIDLKPVEAIDFPEKRIRHVAPVHILQGDLRDVDAETLTTHLAARRHDRFDVLLSDMAPYTTGDRTMDHHRSVRLCDAMLDRAADLLCEGGNLVMKVFEGEVYADLLARTRIRFAEVKGFKPKASRNESTEMYIVGRNARAASEVAQLSESAQAMDAPLPRPARKPSRGWDATP